MASSFGRATAVLGAELLFGPIPAWTSNLSYSFVNGELGRGVLDNPARLGVERHERLPTISAGASHQLIDWIVARVELSREVHGQTRSESTAETSIPYLAFPIPMGSRFDLIQWVG